MKITFSILTLCRGGAQRMLVELVNGLTKKGHEVTVLLPGAAQLEFDLCARLIRTDSLVPQAADYPLGDIIVSNWYTTVDPSELASRSGKGAHVRLSLCYEPLLGVDCRLAYPSYHVTTNLIVLSKWQQQLIELNHGIRASIVPCGVGDDFWNHGTRLGQRARIEIAAVMRRTDDGESWHRDQAYLVEELTWIKRQRDGVRLTFICPLTEFAQSTTLQGYLPQRSLLARRSLADQLICPKDDMDLCLCYNACDIFVSSSIQDTFALPPLEAMRCGAAVVATYSGGNLEYCRPEENCLLSFRHEAKLGQNLLRLIDDPVLRGRISAAGEREACAWTWERSVTEFEKALQDILRGAEKNHKAIPHSRVA